jgi:hypothetical protein
MKIQTQNISVIMLRGTDWQSKDEEGLTSLATALLTQNVKPRKIHSVRISPIS